MNLFRVSKILLATSLIALMGCKEEFKGRINVAEPMKLNSEKGLANIPAGDHAFEVEIKKDKLKVEVKNSTTKKKVKAEFRIPGVQMPDQNGPIEVLAAQSGQPYDLIGTLGTEQNQSPERWEWESCRRYHHGHPYCHPRDYWCHKVYYGRREIRFYDILTMRTVELDVEAPTSKKLIGTVSARNDSRRRVYTYVGHCF